MRIPTVNVPDGPQGQQTFAPTPVSLYDQVGQAGARLGNIAGEVATDLPIRIKTAIDQGTLQDVEVKSQAALADQLNQFNDGQDPRNGDPGTFKDRWQSSQKAFQDKLGEDSSVQGLSLEARIQYQNHMKAWADHSNMVVGQVATEKALEITQSKYIDAFHARLMGGDEAGAVAGLQDGIKRGAIKPEIGLPLIHHAPIENEKNQAVAMMSGSYLMGKGPIVLEKALNEQDKDGNFVNYPHLVGQDREQMMFDAFRNARGLEAQTAQKYSAMKLNGDQPDAGEVHRDMVLGALSPAAAKGILTVPKQKLYSPDAFSGIMQQISHADLSHDDTHEKEALIRQNIAASHDFLDTPSLERLNEAVKQSLNPKSEVNTPVASAFFKQAEKDHESGMFLPYHTESTTTTTPKTGLGGFLGIGTPAKTETKSELKPEAFESQSSRQHWSEVLPPEKIEAERTRYTDYLTKMRQFFVDHTKDGKAPTDTEVNEYAATLRRPYAMEHVAQALSSASPAKPSSQDDQARQWAMANPSDPRSAKILQKLGGK